MKTSRNKNEFSAAVENDAGGDYVVLVRALSGCHTQAKSRDWLINQIEEAIGLCLEKLGTTTDVSEFIGVQRVAIG